ncbi:hypothetical protein ACJRO7_000510 [Eucalyptus globulus]|uniref:Transmembrane 9 superfamily member n=1 Tax=Eucalyptus globulus TaxID=34317 RepID=A0ABD3LMU7_EUCGL
MTSSAIRNRVFFALSSIWFSLARSFMRTYAGDDLKFAEVNSLTSIDNGLPFSYYSVPYCKPMGGIRQRVGNVSIYLCTTDPLSEHEARLLKQRARDLYRVNMMLDGLPAVRYASDDVYIINHLKFTVLVNEHRSRGYDITDFDLPSVSKGYEPAPPFEIVGFTVAPCSVKHDQEYMKRLKMYNIDSMECPSDLETLQAVRENERISFTYEVQFLKSDIHWQSRWDIYLKQRYSRIGWFSVLRSLTTILLLTGIVFVIFLKTIARELAKCQGLNKQAEAQTSEEPSGWKLLASDAFREPNYSRLLRLILTLILNVYSFWGTVGGYIGVRKWRTLKGSIDGWKSVLWLITFLFPGIILIVHVALNFIMWVNHSTAAISISTYSGGLLATWAEAIQYPVKTNHIPREIPLGHSPRGSYTLVTELIFFLSSIWLGRFYSVLGTLCICLLSLVILSEDWKWWWRSFCASGSASLFVFMYCINYLVSEPNGLSGPPSVTVYVGYLLIMTIAALLSTGSIGFLASLYFVNALFSSTEI